MLINPLNCSRKEETRDAEKNVFLKRIELLMKKEKQLKQVGILQCHIVTA